MLGRFKLLNVCLLSFLCFISQYLQHQASQKAIPNTHNPSFPPTMLAFPNVRGKTNSHSTTDDSSLTLLFQGKRKMVPGGTPNMEKIFTLHFHQGYLIILYHYEDFFKLTTL